MIDPAVAGGVAADAMARPPVNAINDAFLAAFERRLDELEPDSGAAAVAVCSGQRRFGAGADVSRIRGFFYGEASTGLLEIPLRERTAWGVPREKR